MSASHAVASSLGCSQGDFWNEKGSMTHGAWNLRICTIPCSLFHALCPNKPKTPKKKGTHNRVQRQTCSYYSIYVVVELLCFRFNTTHTHPHIYMIHAYISRTHKHADTAAHHAWYTPAEVVWICLKKHRKKNGGR